MSLSTIQVRDGTGAAQFMLVDGSGTALPGGQPFTWVHKIGDGANVAALVQGKNADAQVLSATNWQLDTSSISTWLNPSGTFDRSRSMGAQGDGLGVELVCQPPCAGQISASGGPGVAVTKTFTGVANSKHVITWIIASYSGGGTLTNGRLFVNDSVLGGQVLDIDVSSLGIFNVPLPPGGLAGALGSTLTVTLASGGIGINGKLSVGKYTY